MVGLAVLPPPDLEAQRDPADPLDRRILLRSALVASAARAAEDRQAADLLIVPPMNHIDLLDWTSFDAAIEVGYRTTMEALDKAKATPVGARLFLA